MPEDLSSQIIQLQNDLEGGNTSALTTFWTAVGEQGTPLIEPLPDDEGHVLVTFVWRGNEDTQNLVIFGGLSHLESIEHHQMTRLLETDLWYKTYKVWSDVRTTYQFSLNDSLIPIDQDPDAKTRIQSFVHDPLNPRQFIYIKDEEDPESRETIISVLELAHASAQPWISKREDVPNGQVDMHRFASTILGNERRVFVYTPPGYSTEHEPYGLMVLFDGSAYIQFVPTPTIMDNLLSEGKIPPLVVVLPDSLSQETRSRELPCYPPHVDYLKQELLPWVHEHYHVTNDPAQTIIAGSSYGGLASTFAALQAPDMFGNVLSQSGAFWWGQDHPDDPGPEWLSRQFAQSEKLPVRFYMDVGLLERSATHDMVGTNRRLRDVLRKKGYAVSYSEYAGGHDYVCWRGTLSDGLIALTQSWDAH
jgi:enterochelin esterase family protein